MNGALLALFTHTAFFIYMLAGHITYTVYMCHGRDEQGSVCSSVHEQPDIYSSTNTRFMAPAHCCGACTVATSIHPVEK